MSVTIHFDHDTVDGARAARFIQRRLYVVPLLTIGSHRQDAQLPVS